MQHISKRKRLAAMWGAFVVSTFIAIDVGAVFLGLIYVFLEGVLACIFYVLLFGVILVLFIRFCRHVYKVELELTVEKERK